MTQQTIIIDADRARAESLYSHLRQDGAQQVIILPSAEQFLRELTAGALRPKLLLYAVQENACEIIRNIRRCWPEISIIALLDWSQAEDGMHYIAAGAENILVMPCSGAQVSVAVHGVFVRQQLQREAQRVLAGEAVTLDELAAESSAMRATLFLATGLAKSDAPVVLEGTPGSGRELLARAIHRASARQHENFISFDVAVSPSEFVEQALLGDAQHIGILESVGRGTLLLHNVDALADSLQEELVKRLKAQDATAFTGRLMLAVNEVSRGRNKLHSKSMQEFYSQIDALHVTLPELHEMREDIPYLAWLYCRRYAAVQGKTIFGIAPAAEKLLKELSWPGNIEQLSRAVFKAVMLCQGVELQAEDFRHLVEARDASVSYLQGSGKVGDAASEGVLSFMDEEGNVRRLEEMEQEIIRYALERYSGHMSEVARYLGIGRSTLYRKLSSMDESK